MNPNTISWLHYQDIQIPDVALQQQFNQYMLNGQYSQAIALLNTNEVQLQGKAYVASTITTILNGIIELESLYNTGVTLYLSNLASQYMTMISNLSKKGQYSETTQYYPYNFVIYNQDLYMAIEEPPIGTAPTNQSYWLFIGLRGEDGAPGTNVVMQYNWNSNVQYQTNDLVVYNSNIYVALQNNNNIIPGTEQENWMLFIMTNPGEINVGISAPINPLLNTIWMKVSDDPLTATSNTPISGILYYYNSLGTWEEIYPLTIFNCIADKGSYAPKLNIYNLIINPSQWELQLNSYNFTYNNVLIDNNSFIEVFASPNLTEEQKILFNNLSMSINSNAIIFTSSINPTVAIELNICIQ